MVRQLQQVFEPYRLMFMQLKERQEQLPSDWFCKEKKNTER
jgi:hypothetical protein